MRARRAVISGVAILAAALLPGLARALDLPTPRLVPTLDSPWKGSGGGPRLRFPITRWLAPGIGLPFSAGPYEYVAQAPWYGGLALGYAF